ncbi:MAG: hypothetical protein IJ435_01390 [Clostridia bacterium]|nr:hypothetical protein [Clostridia bacterium]
MTSIMINTKCKQYKKDDKATRRSINELAEKLIRKINSENCSDINEIFNNDSIVYDRLNNELFIFKGHGVNNTQIRMVYGYKSEGKDSVLYLVDYTSKKSNNKEYIRDMNTRYKQTKIVDMVFVDVNCVGI